MTIFIDVKKGFDKNQPHDFFIKTLKDTGVYGYLLGMIMNLHTSTLLKGKYCQSKARRNSVSINNS